LVGKAMRLWMNGLGTTDITDLIRDLWNIDSLLTRTQSSIMSYTFQSSFQGLSTSQDIRVHWSGPQDLLVQWSLMTHSGSDLWTRTISAWFVKHGLSPWFGNYMSRSSPWFVKHEPSPWFTKHGLSPWFVKHGLSPWFVKHGLNPWLVKHELCPRFFQSGIFLT
jgi:hypothetical protein